MLRVNLLFRNPAGLQYNVESKKRVGEQKVHEFFTNYALDFDYKNPPANVVLYRQSKVLCKKGLYPAAEMLLKEALSVAEKEGCPDTTIRLYKTDINNIQEFVNRTKTPTLASWLKSITGAFTFFGAGYYCRNPIPLKQIF